MCGDQHHSDGEQGPVTQNRHPTVNPTPAAITIATSTLFVAPRIGWSVRRKKPTGQIDWRLAHRVQGTHCDKNLSR